MGLPNNIFTDDFIKTEIKWFNVSSIFAKSVNIVCKPILGRCDDFLNVQLRFDPELISPILSLNGEIWMSLTPMEIQSHVVSIAKAKGVVGAGGLGLGYFALKVAEKPNVTKIDVYEINQDVIHYFKTTFKDRTGFEKINIIHGNMFDHLKNKEYDFFFNDIYPAILDTGILPDAKKIKNNNNIKEYRFWSQERIILQLYDAGEDCFDSLSIQEYDFFQQWLASPGSKLKSPPGKLKEDELYELYELLY